MSKFTIIHDLQNDIEEKSLFEGVDTTALTRSSFFKHIQSKKPDFAEALEGFWGSVDFIEFVTTTLDGIKLKKGKWKDLDAESQQGLNKLVQLHDKLFPAIAKKTEKSPRNYKDVPATQAGSAAHGRAAERDWVANMA